MFSCGLRSLHRIFHWSNNHQSATCSTTLQVNCFPMLSSTLINACSPCKPKNEVNWSWLQCGNIFPEFLKLSTTKRMKKPRMLPVIIWNARSTRKFSKKWKVGRSWFKVWWGERYDIASGVLRRRQGSFFQTFRLEVWDVRGDGSKETGKKNCCEEKLKWTS